jgi:Tol biopolymer transport system component
MSQAEGWNLGVVDVSTRSVRVVVHNADGNARPAWSPDGSRIAYVRYGPTSQELVTVRATGGGVRVVTRMIGSPRGISWRAHH